MPTPTKRYVNWFAVGFTPTSGSAVVLDGVTDVSFDEGGSVIKFSGDGDRFPTTIVNDYAEPSATVTLADLGAVKNCPVGTYGVFTATHGDAKNQATSGGGGIVYTMANAMIGNTTKAGAHRQFGSGTIQVTCYAPDGVTNPLSTSAA